MPPGPWSFPLLGVLHKVNINAPHLTFMEWGKRYGDVISMTMFGRQKAVVVNSEEALRTVLVTRAEYFSGMERHLTVTAIGNCIECS